MTWLLANITLETLPVVREVGVIHAVYRLLLHAGCERRKRRGLRMADGIEDARQEKYFPLSRCLRRHRMFHCMHAIRAPLARIPPLAEVEGLLS